MPESSVPRPFADVMGEATQPTNGHRTGYTAVELLATDFPEPRFAVPGIIAEGLNLLVGAPKLGKSWFALNIAIAVASGGRALGKVPVEQGGVTPPRINRPVEPVHPDFDDFQPIPPIPRGAEPCLGPAPSASDRTATRSSMRPLVGARCGT